ITDGEFIIDDCAFSWTSDGSAIAFDASTCQTSNRVGWRWFGPIRSDSLLATADGDVIIESDGGYTRLDRVVPGTVGQPTLGAFLGTVSHRRWILDEPAEVYPSGVRPFVQFAPYEAPDVVPAAYGFDGCGYIEAGRDAPKAGAWTSAEDGWAFYAADAGTLVQPADCAPELWLPFTGVTYRLLGTRELEMVTADGTTWLFRDAESLPNNDPASNPPGLVVGRWTLDDEGAVIDFDETTVGFDGCSMSWAATSDRTIGLTTPQKCDAITDRSLLRFVQLSEAERAITVGLSDDLTTMYLYTDHQLFTALRFSRVP
ncbi:MAG TPA: hypothetical protein VMM60_18000, partial [Ilumatobacter sp.]|nr:hypothetical protein [Ilumatobacter sp.]